MSFTRFVNSLLFFLLALGVLAFAKPVEHAAEELATRGGGCSGGCSSGDVVSIFLALKVSISSACSGVTGSGNPSHLINAIIAACNTAIAALGAITAIVAGDIVADTAIVVGICGDILILIVVTICKFNSIVLLLEVLLLVSLNGCLVQLLVALNLLFSGCLAGIGGIISGHSGLFLQLGLGLVLSLCGL